MFNRLTFNKYYIIIVFKPVYLRNKIAYKNHKMLKFASGLAKVNNKF